MNLDLLILLLTVGHSISQTCESGPNGKSNQPKALVYFDPDDKFELYKTPLEALESIGYFVTLKPSKEKLLGGWNPLEYVEQAEEGFDFIWEPRSVTHQTQYIAQRIRKFPFIEAELNLDCHMKTFLIPQQQKECEQYLEDNRKPYWVVKNPYHHHNKVFGLSKTKSTIKDMSRAKYSKRFNDKLWASILVQEFLDRPYLIDGFKIDYSIFIAITSLFPLRLYASNTYTFVRKSKKPYFPLDPNDSGKTVVGSVFDGCGPLDAV